MLKLPLSPQEVRISQLISEGFSNAEIAEIMSLSVCTVRNYIFRIYKKVRVTNRVQLTNWLRLS